VLAHRAEVVAEVKPPRRLDSGDDAHVQSVQPDHAAHERMRSVSPGGIERAERLCDG
jgi:hypothetical protein